MPDHQHWGPGRHMFRRVVGIFFFLFLMGAVVGGLIVAGLTTSNGNARWVVVEVIILILVGIGVAGRRRVGRTWAPVGDLIDATQRLGEGETGVRITSMGPGPFGAVGASFNRMATRLEEEDERRRRLLADLGHELRTPLTVIRGEIEAVLDGLHEPESLSHVIDEVGLMERLLEDLRVLALAEAGRLPLHKEPTDIGTLIGDVVDSFSSTLEGLGIATNVDVEPDLAELDIDPQRIHQVLANLMSNAANHLPGGGVVSVRARQEATQIVVEVSDTGPGIPEEQLEHIFERFVSIGDSAGTGLGLSIARDLVEAHGGSIDAANRAGGGAAFTVRLPS